MAASGEQYAYAEINRFIVYVLYALSFLIGIPLNGYIIYRLYARIGKKSYYYRLLMLMSAVDMYIAFFNTVVYYNNRSYIGSSSVHVVILSVLNAVQTILTMIVLIYWKTVVKEKPKLDKVLFAMTGGHFVPYLSIIVLALFFDTKAPNLYGRVMPWLLAMGIGSTAAFIMTSSLCVYSLVIVLREDTGRFSVPTLRAYKRMALAHFVQCIIVETDFITQSFTLGYQLIMTYVLVDLYGNANGQIEFSTLPRGVQQLYEFNVVFINIWYLIPVIKPFVRAGFIAWALRRLLKAERAVTILAPKMPSLRSSTQDN